MNDANGTNPDDREDLVAYLDGELDDAATQEVETKLSQDPAVRTEAEDLKRTWSLLDYLPRPKASEQFTSRTMDKLATIQVASARRARLSRWVAGAGWAAAVVLAGFGGFWMTKHWPKAMPSELPFEDRRLMEHHEYWHQYENVESFDFLKALERSELFSEDL